MNEEMEMLNQWVSLGNLEHGLMLVIILLFRSWVRTLERLDQARCEEIARLVRWLDGRGGPGGRERPDTS